MEARDHGLHIIPDGDLVEHEENYKCVCHPKWKAGWCENHGVEWIFVHNALDGRKEEE